MSNSIRQIVIFLGAPGSGKGTLSRMCVERLGWKQLSTGDLLRQHVQGQTDIGKEIDFTIKSGMLIQDSLIIDIVVQWLLTEAQNADTIIFDGFPRTVPQAESFLSMMSKSFQDVKIKIYRLVVPDAEIVDRLSSRVVCSNKDCQAIYSEKFFAGDSWHSKICSVCNSSLTKRDDDALEKIEVRLSSYYHHIKQVLEYYHQLGCSVVDINGSGPIENVFQELRISLRDSE